MVENTYHKLDKTHVIIHNFTLLCLELKTPSPDDETRTVHFNFNYSQLFRPAHNYYNNRL